MTKKLTCIDCPVGCSLVVEAENGRVSKIEGAKCPKGETYAVSEIEDPVRIVTSTVFTEGLDLRAVPVRTGHAIPKNRIMDIMSEIRKIKIRSPIKRGEAVKENILGLGVNLIATRSAVSSSESKKPSLRANPLSLRAKRSNLPLIIILAILISVGGCSENRKQIGLYQYVRKAHKYMENGKYDKAIYVLHKAYEEAPDNKDIEEQLMSAYIRYSRALEEKGKIDKATDTLEIAYEMNDNNISVVYELAYLYAKRAVTESANKNIGQALDLSLRSVDIALRSKKVRKSISIYFFNQAVEAFRKNDDETVLLSLNASYVLNPGFEILDLFGRHYYRKNNLERALFYWEKAGKIRPQDEGIKSNILKVQRELTLKRDQKTVETEYFNVGFYGDNTIDTESLKRILGKIYNEVGEDLAFYPPRNTPIIFYDEKDFRDIFRQSGIVRAFYDGGSIRIGLNVNIGDPLFTAIMAHEYTHAVISMLTDNKCPIWLHEGLAVLEQSKYIKPVSSDLAMRVKEGEKITLEEVDKGFSEVEKERLTLSYEAAHTAALFMLDKWGWNGIRGILERIKRGKHYANAIDEEFYVTREGFERMWNEDLTKEIK
ncbi:MAG: DUF1667 domain-containing protein [Candidatus Omnitrophota bacterium]